MEPGLFYKKLYDFVIKTETTLILSYNKPEADMLKDFSSNMHILSRTFFGNFNWFQSSGNVKLRVSIGVNYLKRWS